MGKYDKEFYDNQMNGSVNSAHKIVPYIIEQLKPLLITSVVDFGCGVGGWLSEFQKIEEIVEVKGLDFGNAETSQMLISPENFRHMDLSKAIDLKRKYDLAMSVEVGEHLPENCADTFVDNLCNASDIVLFSAAVPGQGGVEHVNEQLPSYWIKKFNDRGYNCYDLIRAHFWSNQEVEAWYRQNAFIFIKNTVNVDNCYFSGMEEKIPIFEIINPDMLVDMGKNYNEQNKKLININYLRIYHPSIYAFLRKFKR